MQTEITSLIKDENAAKAFLRDSSFTGLNVLYTLYLSLAKKKAFNLTTLCSNLVFVNESFFKGYTNGLNSSLINIFLFNTTEKGLIYNTTYLNPFLGALIKNEITERAKKYDSSKDQDWLSKFSWVKQVSNIEGYFNT